MSTCRSRPKRMVCNGTVWRRFDLIDTKTEFYICLELMNFIQLHDKLPYYNNISLARPRGGSNEPTFLRELCLIVKNFRNHHINPLLIVYARTPSPAHFKALGWAIDYCETIKNKYNNLET